VRPAKRGGAFCAYTVPAVHPYVMLNWTSRRRDVLTLAHELGHGVHAALGGQQGIFHMATPLTLAETASVFGEALTFGRMLEAADDAVAPDVPHAAYHARLSSADSGRVPKAPWGYSRRQCSALRNPDLDARERGRGPHGRIAACAGSPPRDGITERGHPRGAGGLPRSTRA